MLTKQPTALDLYCEGKNKIIQAHRKIIKMDLKMMKRNGEDTQIILRDVSKSMKKIPKNGLELKYCVASVQFISGMWPPWEVINFLHWEQREPRICASVSEVNLMSIKCPLFSKFMRLASGDIAMRKKV